MKDYLNFLNEKHDIPEDEYEILKNIAKTIKEHIDVEKESDIDDLIFEYWDEAIDLNDKNIKEVKKIINK